MAGLIGMGHAYKQQALQGMMEDNQRRQKINQENEAIKQAESAQSMQMAGLGAGLGATVAAGTAVGGPVGALAGAALGYAFGELL